MLITFICLRFLLDEDSLENKFSCCLETTDLVYSVFVFLIGITFSFTDLANSLLIYRFIGEILLSDSVLILFTMV